MGVIITLDELSYSADDSDGTRIYITHLDKKWHECRSRRN